jgi:hypothetical protein
MTTDADLRDIVVRLAARVAASDENDAFRDAARATGSLPVYCDMGGCLVVSPDGDVLRFDPESGSTETETDPRWRLLARAKASRRYPELASLEPLRPEDAPECFECEGTGLLLGLDCKRCSGLGWVDNAQPEPERA